MTYEAVIGLEVHAQIAARGKLFSRAGTSFGKTPNSSVSLVDMAFPGTLPTINPFCIEQGVRTALALHSEVQKISRFERKHYFYPDLPQGYQISQYKDPLALGGEVEITDGQGNQKMIALTRLHLEQDAGKLVHDRKPDCSLVDLNRTGTALMEIVTEPVLASAQEAGTFLRTLRAILRTVGSCSGDMSRGEMRADVNISLRRPGKELGTRCEIKNLNSVRFMQQAITWEIARQSEILDDGGRITQETRQFDPDTGRTQAMRSKEEAEDYRYFPDPDLLPVRLDSDWLESLERSVPEIPLEKERRFAQEMQLPAKNARLLAQDPVISAWFEKSIGSRSAKTVSHWICNDIFALSNQTGISLEECRLTPEKMGLVIDAVENSMISPASGREILATLWNKELEARDLITGHEQNRDSGDLARKVDAFLEAHPEEVAKAVRKPTLAGWFTGQIMKQCQGRADARQVAALVKDRLCRPTAEKSETKGDIMENTTPGKPK